MTMSRQFQSTVRLLLATMAVAGMALIAVGAAGSAQAAGLRNCTEISGGWLRSGCWEDVWSGGAEYRMTFATGCCSQFKGKDPGDLDAFYVMAPQDDTPQSLAASFRHDHVVRDIPAQNQGNYSVRLHGYFVVCSAAGIASGACVFEMNSPAAGVHASLRQDGQRTGADLCRAARGSGRGRVDRVGRHRRSDRRLDQPEQVVTQPRSNRRACRDDQRRMTKLRTRTSS